MSKLCILNEATGEWEEHAQGELCYVDGLAIEAYPLHTVEEIIEKLKKTSFKTEFDGVRKGVEAALEHFDQRIPEYVSAKQGAGRRISRRMAWVTKTEYSRLFKHELGSPGCKQPLISGMPSYEGLPLEDGGTALEFEELVISK